MIICNLFKFFFIWSFNSKTKCVVVRVTTFGILKYDCLIKTREMSSFLPSILKVILFSILFTYVIIGRLPVPLINNSVTIVLSFLLSAYQQSDPEPPTIMLFYVFFYSNIKVNHFCIILLYHYI